VRILFQKIKVQLKKEKKNHNKKNPRSISFLYSTAAAAQLWVSAPFGSRRRRQSLAPMASIYSSPLDFVIWTDSTREWVLCSGSLAIFVQAELIYPKAIPRL
jgi:hypothetical protein